MMRAASALGMAAILLSGCNGKQPQIYPGQIYVGLRSGKNSASLDKEDQKALNEVSQGSLPQSETMVPVQDASIEWESLHQEALKLRKAGKYPQAVIAEKKALAIAEHSVGSKHLDVASSLDNLASLYLAEGKYSQAEQLYKRSLAIREKILGPDHPDVGTSLNNLGGIYSKQGQHSKAESLFISSLAIFEKSLGPNHYAVAVSLSNLAEFYKTQGKYDQAELFLKRSLAISEKAFGKNHPNVAKYLDNLAKCYMDQGQPDQAEPLYKRALDIREKALDSDHPDVITSLNNLAEFYHNQSNYSQAEPVYENTKIINGDIDHIKCLKLLYGNLTNDLSEPALWIDINFPVDFMKEWKAHTNFTSGHVYVAFEGTYIENDVEKYLILTQTIENELRTCRSCAPIIGAAIFYKKNNKWILESENKFITVLGGYGWLINPSMEKNQTSVSIIKVGPEKWGILIKGSSYNMGYESNWISLITPYKETIIESLRSGSEGATSGACDDLQAKKTQDIRLRYKTNPQSDYYDMTVVKYRNSGSCGNIKSVTEVEKFKFANGFYRKSE